MEKKTRDKRDTPHSAMVPSVHKQLLLSLKAGSHIPPAGQGLEPSAENSEKEVPLRRRAPLGCYWALLQVSSHILEKNKTKTFTYFYCWSQGLIPRCEARKSSELTVHPNQDSEMGLTGLGERFPKSWA